MVLPCGTGLENKATARLHGHVVTLLLRRRLQQMPAAAGEQVVVCVLPFYVACDVNTHKRLMVLSRVCVATRYNRLVWRDVLLFSGPGSPGSRRPSCLIVKHLDQNLDQIPPPCCSGEEKDLRDLRVYLAAHHIETTRR